MKGETEDRQEREGKELVKHIIYNIIKTMESLFTRMSIHTHTHILYIVDINAVLPVKNKNKDKKQDRNTQIFILKSTHIPNNYTEYED